MRRSIVIGLIGIPAVLVVIGLGCALWLRTSLPDTSGVVQLAGLSSPVSIVRNDDGIPHIYAETDEDAYFALGYVHAQDRFWQMESMRRFGAGRLSEVLGEATLGADRWMRTLGLYRLAQAQVKALDDPVRQALDAYANGVNRWLENQSGLPSLEFAGLWYHPEPWQVADSLVWGKIMATRLAGNYRTEILRAQIARKIAPARVGELWPAYPADAPVTVAGLSGKSTDILLSGLSALPPWSIGRPVGASNFWAVGSAKTDTGGAFLANDPHLGFSAPIMWYLARIKTPSLSITGATVPGVPFHVLGVNSAIAWGVTSTQADSEDLFVEKLSAEDPQRYKVPGGDAAFESRQEIIKIKGKADQTLTVRTSRHGPIISDLRSAARSLGDDGYVIALSATYLDGSDTTTTAFYQLNRANSWQSFKASLRHLHAPVLNTVFADTDGNIGYMTAGQIPIRAHGRGVVPSPGWSGKTDWRGRIPFEQMPSAYNPATSTVVNANNRIIGPEYPYFVSYDWAARYRAERIEQRLSGSDHLSLKQMQSMQGDNLSLMATDLLPRLLDVMKPGSPSRSPLLALLQKWDGNMIRERPEPLIFSTWMLELNKLVYSDELAELTPQFLNLRPRFIKSVLSRRQIWCDNIKTAKIEECALLVRRAFDTTVERLTEQYGPDHRTWMWGVAHQATFSHPLLSRVPLINRLSDIKIASNGGNYTVNRGATRPNNDARPFSHIHGPGFRAIYDMKDLDNSRFMIATGQSGNPLSRHYSDFVVRWRDVKYAQFLKDGVNALTEGNETLHLLPLPRTENNGANDAKP